MYKQVKKLLLIVAVIITVLFFSSVTIYATEVNRNENSVYAVNNTQNSDNQVEASNNNSSKSSTTETLVKMKDDQAKDLESLEEKYGSKTYGTVAYILNLIQKYSIPIGIVGIAICGIYEYVIGMKRLDIRDKGFNTMIAVITIVIICQILPLVFTIVVKSTD